jgi:hypothetical protein
MKDSFTSPVNGSEYDILNDPVVKAEVKRFLELLEHDRGFYHVIRVLSQNGRKGKILHLIDDGMKLKSSEVQAQFRTDLDWGK